MPASPFSGLSIEEKVGQLFFIGIPGPQADDITRQLVEHVRPGGICLFARNIREAAQTRGLIEDVSAIAGNNPLISLDQEGGLVDRLRRVVTPMPAANRIRTASQAKRLGELVAEVVRILGFNMDFAPVVDVSSEARAGSSNGLAARAFGNSAEDVVKLAGAFLEGLSEGGVIGCLKHFPGLGASQIDSHEELPFVDIDMEELRNVDLVPYAKLLGQAEPAAVMVAHAAFPGLDLQETAQNGKLLPSSLSYNFVTNLLRRDLGFKGVAITDDLEMGAVVKHFGIGEACRLAVLAGEDMLAICADPKAITYGFDAVVSAVRAGEIAESRIDESLGRIGRLKDLMKEPLDLDPARLETLSREIAEFNATLN